MELLQQIAELWRQQIRHAAEQKEKDYSVAAREVSRFCGRTYDASTAPQTRDEDFPLARQCTDLFGFLPKRALAAEFVDVTLPYIYARVPNRVVSPLAPPVPPELRLALPQAAAMQDATRQRYAIMSYLLNWVLNWLPRVNNLKREGLLAAEESLVMGRGILWHEDNEGPYGDVPASNFGSTRHLLIDPDCEQHRDAGFIVRRRVESVYRIADKFTIDRDELRGQFASYASSALEQTLFGQDVSPRPDGSERDVGVFYEVFSRVGIGHKMLGVPDEWQEMATAFDEFGAYCYLAIMDGVNYPLNLRPDKFTKTATLDQIRELRPWTEWPIKTYGNYDDPWPCSFLDFRPDTRTPWARPPLEPYMPLLRFVDAAYRFAMLAVRNSVRQVTITSKALSQGVQDAMAEGYHDEICQMEGEPGTELGKLIYTIQHPPTGADLWRIIPMVEDAFRLGAGMQREMYGSTPETQDRSATATNAREQRLVSRSNYYADCVETFMSAVGNKEMILARQMNPASLQGLFADGTQVNPEDGAVTLPGAWMQQWMDTCYTDNPEVAAGDVAVSVEAGTGRPKNMQKKIADSTQISQTFGPAAMQAFTAGSAAPLAAIADIMGDAMEDDLTPLANAFQEAVGIAQQQAMLQQQAQQQGPPGGTAEPTPPAPDQLPPELPQGM